MDKDSNTKSKENRTPQGPLSGIKVIDWTLWQFGPVAAMMLGDLGADVIKVEPLTGEQGRAMFTLSGIDRSLPGGRNSYFEANQRNKRSIALDLKQPEGVDVVRNLVSESDIFLQNYRKGVAERLGLGYEDLKLVNDKIIYGSGSGYGPEGPDAYKPALDTVGQARSGLMYATGPDGDDPYPIQGVVADQIGGIMLSWGILAALYARQATGVGQRVDASHLGSSIWLQGLGVSMSMLTAHKPSSETNLTAKPSRDKAYNPISNYYRCKDGRWLMLANLEADRYWPTFSRAVGIEGLAKDKKFIDTVSRAKNNRELIKLLDEVFASKTYKEWDDILSSAGDFIYAPVQQLMELWDDPQVQANKYIVETDHPTLGKIKLANHPIQYSETPSSIRRVAPEIGEHTEEILLEVGYSWDDISNLQDKGVIL
jgi:crotonobetainyl-CoA:carnitine CoA-transferase CaiB-like acyl-CoA transferase